LAHNRFHAFLMVWTAAMVVLTDFMIGVSSAIVLYAVLYRFLDTPVEAEKPVAEPALKPATVDREFDERQRTD